MAYKPDSVQVLPPWMTIPLGCLLPDTSSCQPGPLGQDCPGVAPARSLLGIAPGGACRAALVAKRAVGSYPTVSPSPAQAQAVCSLWRFPSGFPGRVLPGTIALWSPDFPRVTQGHAPTVTRGHPAIRAKFDLGQGCRQVNAEAFGKVTDDPHVTGV